MEMYIVLANSVLTLMLLVFIALVFYKVYKLHLMQYELSDRLTLVGEYSFKQVESLIAIYKDLDFNKSIPMTRGWVASPDFLRYVYEGIAECRPTTVVECSSGVSTVIIAKALKLQGFGHVYSLESDEHYAKKTRDLLAKYELSDWATVIYAPLKSINLQGQAYQWYDAKELEVEQIDMMVIDGPYGGICNMARYPAVQLFPRLSASARVYVDDYRRKDEKAMVEQWMEEDKGFALQLLGCEKGGALLTKQ